MFLSDEIKKTAITRQININAIADNHLPKL